MALVSILNIPEERSWFVQEYLQIGQANCLIPGYSTNPITSLLLYMSESLQKSSYVGSDWEYILLLLVEGITK